MNKFYFVYILLSERDNNYYTGYTKNIELRFEQHNKGLVKTINNLERN